MSSKQIIAYGGKTNRSVLGAMFTAIPEAKGLGIPTVETNFADVTNLDSPGGFKEYIKGLKDSGVLTVPCGYTSAGYAEQLSDADLDDPVFYETTLKLAKGQTTADVFTFQGFPTVSVETGDLGAPIGMTVSIRVTGAVTFVAGAA
jgi:hypothetical protein